MWSDKINGHGQEVQNPARHDWTQWNRLRQWNGRNAANRRYANGTNQRLWIQDAANGYRRFPMNFVERHRATTSSGSNAGPRQNRQPPTGGGGGQFYNEPKPEVIFNRYSVYELQKLNRVDEDWNMLFPYRNALKWVDHFQIIVVIT